MSKSHFVALTCILTLLGSAGVAQAQTYKCPAPDLVKCVPTPTPIHTPTPPPGGSIWKANGGAMTGNTFLPNNQCGNMQKLPNGKQRLVCCYTKCGVYTLDVPAAPPCTKNPDGDGFICN